MALSGTLDTFALPDVLRLLASTAKSGRLRITGDRGSGSVWIEDGDVVATELIAANSFSPTSVEVIFGLLRFDTGSFTFELGVRAAQADHPSSMEPILTQAENMLVEWRSIEEVVPSLDVWVGLVAKLKGPDVMIDANRWCGIAAVGGGAQVGVVAETLELNEIDACRTVKELIELGLVEVLDEPVVLPAATAPLVVEPFPVTTEATMVDEMLAGAFDDQPTGGAGTPSFSMSAEVAAPAAPEPSGEYVFAELQDPIDLSATTDDIFARVEHDPNTVPSIASLEPSEGSIDSWPPTDDRLESVSAFVDDETADESAIGDLNPAEMARQLANLSPKAAKAVADAARASTDVEREAALAAVEAEDDTLNRGQLLKFLGSVDS